MTTQVLSQAALDRMQSDRIGEVYGGEARPGMGYGMGWWVDKASGLINDPGAFGAVPWLDLEDGYGAYLVIEVRRHDRLHPRLTALRPRRRGGPCGTMTAVTDFPLPNASLDLTGQVALVTGATSGLGWRFSQVLAAAGATVVAAGAARGPARRAGRADHVASGGTAVPMRLDMTDADDIIAAVGRGRGGARHRHDPVNNAGIPDAQRAHKMSIELIDRCSTPTCAGRSILACEVARRLIAAEQPGPHRQHLVASAPSTTPATAPRCTRSPRRRSHRMTEVLAVEWARFDINVNCIAPGAFASEMMDGMIGRASATSPSTSRASASATRRSSTRRCSTSCAPASEFVTGTIVKVDDGQGPR